MVDWTKPVKLRNGNEVRIWTTDAKADPKYPIRGEYLEDDEWYADEWMASGQFSLYEPSHDNDIVNDDREFRFYNFFDDLSMDPTAFKSLDEALSKRAYSDPGEGVIKVTTENGKLISAEVVHVIG